MKLTIIIPLYNSEKYISACLDSLLDQELSQKEYEIIIIDDGSRDNSLSIVNEYIKRHNNIFVRSQENQGASVARNYGIKMAKGEFLYFVDSDDYIAIKVLKKLISYLSNNIDILAFKTVHLTHSNWVFSNKEEIIISNNEIIDGLKFIVKYGYKDAVGWFFIRKQFLIKNNLFYLEGKKLEDISFNLELFTSVKKIQFLPIDVYRYVERPNSTMTKKNPIHNREIIMDYERVLSEFDNKINKYKAKNSEVTKRLIWKRNIYNFFLIKRILLSNMNTKEFGKKILQYEQANLYPLNHYGNGIKVNTMISILNKKYLLNSLFMINRLLSKK